jgi:ubiquinone/menaquinone biosynthesis C-methylase UbiE
MQELEVDRRILQRLGTMQDILDVGCGNGRLVNFLARQTQKRVVGLDISNHGFAQARKEADQTAIPHLMECVKGDAQHMVAFEDGQFEAITLTFSLHHIEDPEAALQEIYRVLRPGGKVLIGDWVVGEGQPRSECHRFTVGELRRMLEKVGFEQVEVETIEADLILVIGEKE